MKKSNFLQLFLSLVLNFSTVLIAVSANAQERPASGGGRNLSDFNREYQRLRSMQADIERAIKELESKPVLLNSDRRNLQSLREDLIQVKHESAMLMANHLPPNRRAFVSELFEAEIKRRQGSRRPDVSFCRSRLL